jgi:cytochrome P450
MNAIAAACHPNPYPYYQALIDGPALHFDPGLGMWIASREAVIREVLDHPHCLVRPPAEPVPGAIAGSGAGAVFARLIRMNEGAGHAAARQAIASALAALDPDTAARSTACCAQVLAERHCLRDGEALGRWLYQLPTWSVGHLLGFGLQELPQIAAWVADFVRCLSPLSSSGQLAAAHSAAQALRERLVAARPATGLLAQVRMQAEQAGWRDEDAIVANLIGLLSQTHEATAGLIGNSIVAMLRDPSVQQRLRGDPGLADAHVRETARLDPPVQNTRRYVAQAAAIAGVALQPGDTILLVLAATEGELGFGHGRHACPGQPLAMRIAAGAVDYLAARPERLDPAALGWTYRPSVNARLPEFFTIPSGVLP